jgi:cyclophilin family peptidyl-prolyl cis-trans isomerase
VLRPLLLLLAALAFALAACGDDDSGSAETAREDATAQQEPASGDCEDVEQPAPKPDGGAREPKRPLAANRVYEVVLSTSCGDITLRLDQKTSPRTAASFASLVESGFYDGTAFHRIVPGFVIQGGDPTGTGTGGPGYSTRDAPPPDTAYVKGVVAMAKTATEPPGTAGSQFYIVTAPDAGLPADYAVLGKVVEGQDVVDAIGELGDPTSGGAGTPLQPVVIESARLRTR